MENYNLILKKFNKLNILQKTNEINNAITNILSNPNEILDQPSQIKHLLKEIELRIQYVRALILDQPKNNNQLGEYTTTYELISLQNSQIQIDKLRRLIINGNVLEKINDVKKINEKNIINVK